MMGALAIASPRSAGQETLASIQNRRLINPNPSQRPRAGLAVIRRQQLFQRILPRPDPENGRERNPHAHRSPASMRRDGR